MAQFTGYQGVGTRNEKFVLANAQNSVDVYGHGGNDYIEGGLTGDNLYGGYGNDLVYGGNGSDIIFGDTGTHYTGGGADQLAGGNGDDNIFSGSGSDTADGGAGIDDIYGDAGNDRIWGGFDTDNLFGGAGNDIMYGGSEAASSGRLTFSVTVEWNGLTDTAIPPETRSITSADASSDQSFDYMDGGRGNDTLYGQGGGDNLIGNQGVDKLIGGAGSDYLDGGSDADRFIFLQRQDSTRAVRDTIADFSHNQRDRIDLSAIDANTKVSGNQSFRFVEDGPFEKAGDLRSVVSGGNTYVEADVNGDKRADFSVILVGVHDLIKADFVL